MEESKQAFAQAVQEGYDAVTRGREETHKQYAQLEEQGVFKDIERLTEKSNTAEDLTESEQNYYKDIIELVNDFNKWVNEVEAETDASMGLEKVTKEKTERPIIRQEEKEVVQEKAEQAEHTPAIDEDLRKRQEKSKTPDEEKRTSLYRKISDKFRTEAERDPEKLFDDYKQQVDSLFKQIREAAETVKEKKQAHQGLERVIEKHKGDYEQAYQKATEKLTGYFDGELKYFPDSSTSSYEENKRQINNYREKHGALSTERKVANELIKEVLPIVQILDKLKNELEKRYTEYRQLLQEQQRALEQSYGDIKKESTRNKDGRYKRYYSQIEKQNQEALKILDLQIPVKYQL